MGAVTFSSESEDETRALGVRLGRCLQPGDFVGLIGQLGAGKTAFVRGVAEGCDVPAGQVASPTFAIVSPYSGRIPLYHADLYRLADLRELYATGLLEMGDDGAVVVEWLDRIPEATPPDYLELRLSVTGETTRTLSAVAHGARARALLAQWVASGR